MHADKTGKLVSHLPHELKYNKRAKVHKPTKATNIPNRTSIHERPAEADGKRFGDWEMDTIVDSYGHAILTLTERSTNFLLMERLPQGRKALPTAKAVVRLLFPYRDTVRTITTDNGCEFAAHEEITRTLSSKNMRKSSFTLQILTLHGRKELLRTLINSSENISRKSLISTIIQTRKLWKYKRN